MMPSIGDLDDLAPGTRRARRDTASAAADIEETLVRLNQAGTSRPCWRPAKLGNRYAD